MPSVLSKSKARVFKYADMVKLSNPSEQLGIMESEISLIACKNRSNFEETGHFFALEFLF